MSADDLALERGQRVGQLSALLEAVQRLQAPMDILAHLLRIQALLQRELLLVESWCVPTASCCGWQTCVWGTAYGLTPQRFTHSQ